MYYFLAYFDVQQQQPQCAPVELQFVVPTGNFGDILVGYYVRRMGLPMHAKLGVATNANDILTRFWRTGRYEKVDDSSDVPLGVVDGKQAEGGHGVKETLSPAMDILVSSNFERLLWYLAYENKGDRDRACQVVDGWMGKMKADGRVEVPVSVLEAARQDFCAETVGTTRYVLNLLP